MHSCSRRALTLVVALTLSLVAGVSFAVPVTAQHQHDAKSNWMMPGGAHPDGI